MYPPGLPKSFSLFLRHLTPAVVPWAISRTQNSLGCGRTVQTYDPLLRPHPSRAQNALPKWITHVHLGSREFGASPTRELYEQARARGEQPDSRAERQGNSGAGLPRQDEKRREIDDRSGKEHRDGGPGTGELDEHERERYFEERGERDQDAERADDGHSDQRPAQ